MQLRSIPLLAAGLAGLCPAAGFAYSSASLFDTAPSADTTGGSAGIYYTGSPRFQGQDCAGCHLGGDNGVDIELSARPRDLFDGPWEPGHTYRVEVDLLEDRAGPVQCAVPASPCNLNLFALEVIDRDGRPAGALCPVELSEGVCPQTLGAPTTLSADGSVIFASGIRFDEAGLPGFRDRQIRYGFFWRAPDDDRGPLDFWIAAVDGDGAQANPELPSDLANDLTGVFRVTVCGPSGCGEGGEGGCRAAPGPAPAVGLLLGLLASLAWRRR